MSINAERVQRMVLHWLRCPPNGYLGSGYGADLASLMFAPLSGAAADTFLAKLRADIPLIDKLGPEVVRLYSRPEPPDKLRLYIDVAGSLLILDDDRAAIGRATPDTTG